MFLIYFDEVKYGPPAQEHYRLGGIMVEAQLVPELERSVNELSRECFGSAMLSNETEFHAKDIFHGKANFKGRDIEERLETLEKLAKIIDRHDEISKIQICLHPRRMVSHKYEDHAFMHLVERTQMQLSSLSEIGMLIGDHERSRVSPATYDLSRFRQDGTDYRYGKSIDRLIDTVHFSHSHHSRMLQLADVYMYAVQMCASGNETGYTRSRFINFVRDQTQLLSAHRYKNWPTEQSGIQVVTTDA